ncbi:MAG: gluconate 2-dehydrogenase subunit 3 family protein [Pseudomonadota bacterium]|nr:gluconate 2-dehydrogenase subunit 3 family protein [Pseudomonadota bacterium]
MGKHQQGFFADPICLGNRNFIGWKLIGYPGPRYNYDADILRFGEHYPLPMVGLMGRDPSRQPTGPL